MSRPRVATAWLDGCSGCHMSLLDADEWIVELAAAVDVVYSPLVDVKQFPENVDVTLVEGAVSSEDDLQHLREMRARTKILIALGDCAVTGNVPAMRNPFAVDELLQRAYGENATAPSAPRPPCRGVPPLRPKVRPLHELVPVDLYLPGCPPPADAIRFVLSELLAGRVSEPGARTGFGR